MTIKEFMTNIISLRPMYQRRPLCWEDICDGGLSTLLAQCSPLPIVPVVPVVPTVPSMVVTTQTNYQRNDNALFIQNLKKSTARTNLKMMMNKFPELVWVNSDDELCFRRDELIKALRTKASDLIFTSFERGLKHSGLTVIESTHGDTIVKRWAFKNEKNEKKKEKKRENSDDSDFQSVKRKK